MLLRVIVASILVACCSAVAIIITKSQVIKPTENPPAVDGPDKAHLQNYWMTHDLESGRIPYERMQHAHEDETYGRRMTAADFNWRNWETKIPGRGRVVFFHKPSQTLFTGSVSGGLWKNTDYANNGKWAPVEDFGGASVNCMVQDPINENILYVGTGESFTAFVNYRESTAIGSGIFKSTDAGNSWTKIPGTQSFFFVNDLVVRNEGGTSVLYVAAGSGSYRGRDFKSDGLYRSVNQGSTWTQLLPLVPGTNDQYAVADLELTATNRLYAATQRNINEKGGGIIWHSDNGTTWNSYTGFASLTSTMPGWFAGRSVVRHAPSNPMHVYAIFTRGFYNGLNQLRDYVTELRHSNDGGISWSIVQLPQDWANIPWHALSLAVDPINENKIVIAGLDVFVLNNTQAPDITPVSWIRASDWLAMYSLYDPTISQEEKETIAKRYVHGDIHDLNFFNNDSDDMLVTTDGGVFLTNDMSVTNSFDPEIPQQQLPAFKQLNNSLNTTQFYYARIHPDKGVSKIVGGTQDNGCIYVDNDNASESMISGGDGGYCFWDADHPELKISTVYGNGFFIHRGDEIFFNGVVNGLFVNPMDYDDEANFLYTNAATSSFGGLYTQLKTRYYDTLEILNVNKYLQTEDHGLDTVSFIKLNTGIKEAITAIKLSKHSSGLNKTAVIGTENGKVFKLTGLPKSVKSVRIDNFKLPAGYISSVDIGADENSILVTISNFGSHSVWVTYNNGTGWKSLEHDLPDMPVRWGLFNPYDDKKVVIATEAGVWGLENTLTGTQWKSYNYGLPTTRVDMIDIRKSDSTILAVTHGHGLWTGKLNQGNVVTDVPVEPIVTSVEDMERKITFVYPNPATDIITLTDPRITQVVFRTRDGKKMGSIPVKNSQADIRQIQNGLYVVELLDRENRFVGIQKLFKQ